MNNITNMMGRAHRLDQRSQRYASESVQNPASVSTPNLLGRNVRARLPEVRAWEDIKIRVDNVPIERCKPLDLHKLFLGYGHVTFIRCIGRGSAEVSFAFHRAELFSTTIRCGGRNLSVFRVHQEAEMINFPPSSNNMMRKRTVVPVKHIDFGVTTGEHRMMIMHTATSMTEHPAVLKLDIHVEKRHCLEIRFFLTTEESAPWYQIELRLSSPIKILQIMHDDCRKELVITSEAPPKWWQSVGHDLLEEIHQNSSDRYFDWPRGWRRVTDIDLNPDERDLSPVSFVHPSPVIDTGRWLTWRLSFPADTDDSDYNAILKVLVDHNSVVEKVEASRFHALPREDLVVWDLLDPHRASHESDLHEMQGDMMHLSQDIRYQLEVCISHNKIIEHNMTKEFLCKLAAMDSSFVRNPGDASFKSPALVLLENVADSKQTFFDPMDIFTANDLRHLRKHRVPKGSILMRTAVITPTTFYVKTPTVEVSNRVIRDNFKAEGNFLRVRFTDEDTFGGLSSLAEYDNQHEVWERVERCLRHGIDIAGRHYDWLACGNSQFRERGAYFFAPFDENTTAKNIRLRLGDFSHINVVAKCMARIGQCFSTTRASTNIGSVIPLKIKDVERNKYCFTDGVGKVSPFIAQMVAHELYTPRGPLDYPSVFQFRLGGYKGILAVDPSLKGREIHVRPSQEKFDAPSVGLEIIRASRFSTSTLNQQLILVLTGLGVNKQVFVEKMTQELQNIDLAMNDANTAIMMLQKNVDFNQVTLSIAKMILDGFMESREPFLQAVMELWRAWNLKYLKEKAKIPIERGAFVFGCVDETNTLRMDADKLPEIFIQVPGDQEGEWKIVQGICLLARNPSLHPGDIRVVKAVDCEGLSHLRNVVVLPQQGQRPLANMCSGGDLDGDDYLVMWDDDLLPPESQWNVPAMNYDAPTPVMCAGPVQDEHFIKFFVDYIKHDNLGQIAVNHRAMADIHATSGGVGHPACLKLAQLHSQAVDFNKTGVPAIVDRNLWPRVYPHWIPGKPANRQYKSKQILGVLFDMVQRVEFTPLLEQPFDRRILDAYESDEGILEKAKLLKLEYDQHIRRIMAQHDIRTEFEIWTGFAMDHNREKHWYSLAEELGNRMALIKMTFQTAVRKECQLTEPYYTATEEAFNKLAPFVAAMYKVTAQEVAKWQDSELQGKLILVGENSDKRPLISFPWIFANELGMIATAQSGPSSLKAAFAPNFEVNMRAPVAKHKFKSELYSIKLEPVNEWNPEGKNAVDDHVGNVGMRSTVDDPADSGNVSDASVGAEDSSPATTIAKASGFMEVGTNSTENEATSGDDDGSGDGEEDSGCDMAEEEQEEEVEESPFDRLTALMGA